MFHARVFVKLFFVIIWKFIFPSASVLFIITIMRNINFRRNRHVLSRKFKNWMPIFFWISWRMKGLFRFTIVKILVSGNIAKFWRDSLYVYRSLVKNTKCMHNLDNLKKWYGLKWHQFEQLLKSCDILLLFDFTNITQ